MSILTITNLTKYYGKNKALDNLNLRIEAGNIYGLLGPNGSGKTTTLGIILGILSQSSGSYEWFDGKYGDKHRRRIGSILETPNFYPYLNADKNLEIIAQIKKAQSVDYDELLELVDLKERRKSKFSTYSLGMKQRLAIAATLIGDPDVLIFDEPTNGLDPQGIAEVRNILQKVAGLNKTVIMASHILDEVEKICSHVCIIKKGKLLATGTVGQILTDDITLEISALDMDSLEQAIRDQAWVTSITRKNNHLECMIKKTQSADQVSKWAYEQGFYPTHLVVRKKSLEEEFLTITSHA